MPYYTTEQIGLSRELTPEGYLLCKGAAIARTGVMFYASGEVPVTPVNGLVRIERSPEEVFGERTMASFEGKPLTIDHPAVDVTPANWRQLASGFVQNVRRGTGHQNDLLVADILVTDAAGIEAIEAGTVELSAGYDADYSEIEPGRGRQSNILGNHVALVEKGRCGARCAIGDSDTTMAAVATPPKKTKWTDRLRAAFKARDEEAMEKALSESTVDDAEETEEEKKKRAAEEGKTGDALAKVADALKTIDARLAALETRDAKAKDEDEDDPKDQDADGKTEDEEDEDKNKKSDSDKARDSAAVVSEAQDVYARAEILAPGLSLPTVDAANPVKMRDSLCAVRRKALETAFSGKYRDSVAPFVGAAPDFAKMTCDSLHGAFIGASELVKRENNAQTKVTYDIKTPAGVAGSITDINRRNAAFWNRQ